VALAALLVCGCGGVATNTGSGGAGGTGAGEAAGRDTGGRGTGGAPESGGATESGGAGPSATSACMEEAARRSPGTPVQDPACGDGCLCSYCAAEMFDCYDGSDPYCGTILDCSKAHACIGVACYAQQTCQAVIDGANGGLSSNAVALASDLMDCSGRNGRFSNRMGKMCPLRCL
jgi:hypothetical protein